MPKWERQSPRWPRRAKRRRGFRRVRVADLTLCCRRDRRGFCEECLRLKDYEIYGFAVLAADRAGCGFADALVGCTGGVLVPPFSAYPQR
jgi:hypothetical protein